jgi:glycosyltransferase involved in cell wall biosynthesis
LEKKKIAIFGLKTYPAFAGADRVVENIINNLDEEYEYHIYLINTKQNVTNFSNKHFIYLPWLKGKHLKAFSFFSLCTLHMLFKSNYDLIHAHNSDVGLFTFILRIKYHQKIIGTFHGNPYESAKWGTVAKLYLKISEYFFIKSCSKLTSVSVSKAVVGKKIFFIPNGLEKIEMGFFRKYNNTSIDFDNLKIKKGNYILFAAGRLDKRKGLHYLLKAYGKNPISQQLVIISDFSHDIPYSESINRQIKEITKKDIIVIRKLLPKNDLFDVIINAKLVVFPSEIEAMSMFLLEVLACKTTLVCSDIESNLEIVGKD